MEIVEEDHYQQNNGPESDGKFERRIIKMDSEPHKKERRFSEKTIVIIAFATIFVGIFIFFRFVCMIVPWDGDDWYSLIDIKSWTSPIPLIGYHGALPKQLSTRILPAFLGGLMNDFSGFVLYPLLGDYILSFVITGALTLAIFISVSLIPVYLLLKQLTQKRIESVLYLLLFLGLAFTFFKADPGKTSSYLYWLQNYSDIPSYAGCAYLCGAFALCLLLRDYRGKQYGSDWQTAIYLTALTILSFSYSPAVFFIGVVSCLLLASHIWGEKRKRKWLQDNWFYVTAIILCIIKHLTELYSVYSGNYFSAPTQIGPRLVQSLTCICTTFTQMNKLFLWFAIVVIVLGITTLVSSYRKGIPSEQDQFFLYLLTILIPSFVAMFFYFVLLGTASFAHIAPPSGLMVRMDTLYIFYFIFLLLVTLCAGYCLQKAKRAMLITPLLLFACAFLISTTSGFANTRYLDTTSRQRYEIMREIVERAKLADERGENLISAHMPPYNFFGGAGMSGCMQYHHVTDRVVWVSIDVAEGIEDFYFD